MTRYLRVGAINKVLIIVLVAVALVAVVFSVVRWRSAAADRAAASGAITEPTEHTLWCSNCKQEFKIAAAEAKKPGAFPRNEEKMVQCPKCKQFTANWGRAPAGGGVAVP